MKLVIGLFALILSANSFARAWDPAVSNPSVLGNNIEYRFEELPTSGKANSQNKFWTGDYWRNQWGNINYRWNSPGEEGFNLNSPSLATAQVMSQKALSQLSPAEKYDLWTGRYSYPLTSEVASEYADGSADEWEGICHGWAPASMNHSEPTPKTMVNPDGVVVPFGSSDIKALISYYYANEFKYEAHMMGIRCTQRGFGGIFSKKCKQDLNAGAFHIALGNLIGIQKRGLVADVDRYKEVWNHPIHSYSTEIVKWSKADMNAPKGTVRTVHVETEITYVDEGENSWDPILGTELQKETTKTFRYELELDAYGRIIGGDFKGNERPDFVWFADKALIWVGHFDRLGELMND